jgi:hypothetical protein
VRLTLGALTALCACGGDVVVDGQRGEGGAASSSSRTATSAATGGAGGQGTAGGQAGAPQEFCDGAPCNGVCLENLGCMCGATYGGCTDPAICCLLTGACTSALACPES